MSYGVMGGDIQPQGHAQVLINLIDRGLNLQQAIDAPRVRYISGRGVMMEDGADRAGDRRAGRRAATSACLPPPGLTHRALMGGGQAIMIDPDTGALLGASDIRARTDSRSATRRLAVLVVAAAASAAVLWTSSSPLDARVDPADTRLLTQPAISASHIAFVYAGDLWVADLDGRNVRRLTTDDGRRVEPGVLAGREDDRVQRAVRRQHRRLHRPGRPAARRRG